MCVGNDHGPVGAPLADDFVWHVSDTRPIAGEGRRPISTTPHAGTFVGIRVCLKMCRQFGLKLGDLVVQLTDDADRRTGGRGVGGADRRGSAELHRRRRPPGDA
jgi:hypothetical protein